jgi:archaellum component FlaC
MAIFIKKPSLLLTTLLGSLILASCSSSGVNSTFSNSAKLAAPAAAPDLQQAEVGDAGKNLMQKAQATPIPQRPQLIKKASITIIVNSVDKTIEAVSKLIEKQQGDLIGLQEQQPQANNKRHTATIQLRIPQNALDTTLDELGKLGTLENRNISAEDVGRQLVDFQARLSNLKKTEANLQKIMDKSGSVKDILSVSKELSIVRESIEQIDAQLKSLQNQVSYSTITLNLKASVAGNAPQSALSPQLQETWNSSTRSLGNLTIGLLKLGIWMMVYSPYLLILSGAIYGFHRWRASAKVQTSNVSPSQSANQPSESPPSEI